MHLIHTTQHNCMMNDLLDCTISMKMAVNLKSFNWVYYTYMNSVKMVHDFKGYKLPIIKLRCVKRDNKEYNRDLCCTWLTAFVVYVHR